MADETEQMIWQGDEWSGMFVHRDFCRNTTGRSPFESGPVQVSSLMKLWIVVCGDQDDAAGRELDDLVVTRGNDDTDLNLRAGYDVDNDLSDLGPRLYCLSFGTFASELSKSDTTGREPDDRVVVHGYDVSGQNTWKTCDLTTLGSSAVAVSCAYVACNAWDGSAGQKHDAEHDVTDDLTGAFSSDLSKGATENFDSDFESILVRTRSNTTSDRYLDKIVFQDVSLPCSCPAGPRNLITSPDTISAAVHTILNLSILPLSS